MYALLLSAALVFLAELGDKSQLMAMAFTTRYRTRVVLIGVTLATAAMSLISAVAGSLIGDALPTDALGIAAGLVFLLFAVLAVLPAKGGESEDEELSTKGHGAAILVIGLTFSAAELGDKTMLATMTLATQYPWYLIWVGSTIGMVVSAALAVLLGERLLRHIPPHTVKYVSAAAFAAVGAWILLG